jgi:uncharacterized protein (DUF427 family)
LADSDRTIIIEGNHYFPPEDVSTEYLVESSRHTTCPWKDEASYYDVIVGGDRSEAAAWYYPEPSGVFDSFETEEARQEHVSGRIPEAPGQVGAELLAGEPEIRAVDIVASL